jgi:hypothetical protein
LNFFLKSPYKNKELKYENREDGVECEKNPKESKKVCTKRRVI